MAHAWVSIVSIHPIPQYLLLIVKETVKDKVLVDTESVIHKLIYID